MKSFLKLIFTIALTILILPTHSFARENVTDWYIQNLETNITLNKDASLDIEELITADCGNLPDKHGIFRILPTKINHGNGLENLPISNIKITDFLGNDLKYSTSYQNNTVTWKTGDSKKTVTGINYYKISYHVDNAINFSDPSFDELYWNLNGAFWDLEIDKFTTTIHLPQEITKDNSQNWLYSGRIENNTNEYSSLEWLGPNTIKVTSTKPLPTETGITLSLTFPKNIISPYVPSFGEKFGIYFLYLIPLLAFIICYKIWNKYGRDPKINSAIAPEFEIPDKLSPFDMGMIYSNEIFNNSYLSASIINMAVKGIITIEEIPKKSILGKKDFLIKKIADKPNSISTSEKTLLDKLLSYGEKNEVLLSKLENKFYKDLPKIKKTSTDFLNSEGYYDQKTFNYRMYMILGGAFIPTIIFFILIGFINSNQYAPALLTSLFLTSAISIIFGILMIKRTEKGAMTEHRIKGFKLYMEKAEKYRQQFNEKENIFEKFLPYAIMFGITKQWANSMKNIYGEAYFNSYHPVWFYGGALGSFDTNSFTDTINDISNSMANSMASSPSSSGSGGGGFSGGGGGGGGGGGW